MAVIGAGPAGLTCAFYLSLLGHDVTVFESQAEAGGMLRYAIPEYRLPKRVLAREVELIERLGVKFVFNRPVGTSESQLKLNDLDEQFDAVFLSVGTWKESWVYLPGTELKGVLPALSFLERIASGRLSEAGKRVAVIGGGNAAVDSARSAVRMGAEATIIYRRQRKDMPAIKEEVDAAEKEGVRLAFLSAPHRILGDASGNVKGIEISKTRLGEYDPSGRRKPVPTGEVLRFDCDTVILAVGETMDLDFVRASGLTLAESGMLVVDRYSLATSRPKFYAGGDLITGASNVSNAMGFGKKAARKIDEKLTGVKRFAHIFEGFAYDRSTPGSPRLVPRRHSAELAPEVRAKSDQEVVLGLTAAEAHDECGRCLRCDVKG